MYDVPYTVWSVTKTRDDVLFRVRVSRKTATYISQYVIYDYKLVFPNPVYSYVVCIVVSNEEVCGINR